jgi:hypothetical protein
MCCFQRLKMLHCIGAILLFNLKRWPRDISERMIFTTGLFCQVHLASNSFRYKLSRVFSCQSWFSRSSPIHSKQRFVFNLKNEICSWQISNKVENWLFVGIYVTPYINGRLFDINTQSWRLDNASFFATTMSSPRALPQQFPHYLEEYGSLQLFAVMCPFTSYWQRKIRQNFNYVALIKPA